MDYLDPKYRRSYNTKLIIGYILIGISIALGTIILVYAAYGYGINTKSGQIIQNGLVFVDSKPSAATITLNNEIKSSATGSSFVLQSGNYKMSITKAGYTTWSRDFTLDEHSIKRFNYALLLPLKPVETVMSTYDRQPIIVTKSPDMRWLMVGSSTTDGLKVDQYDTSDPSKTAESLNLPATLFTSSEGSFNVVEWSSDSNRFIIQHTNAGLVEYITINRAKPAESFNISTKFQIAASSLSFRKSKTDQYYFINSSDRSLNLLNTSDSSVKQIVAGKVYEFTSLSSNLVDYVTDDIVSGKVDLRLIDNDKTYTLSTIAASQSYVLEASEFQGHWYFVTSTNSAGAYSIYEDPISALSSSASSKASPIVSLSLPATPAYASFSENGRNLVVGDGQNFVTYDFENREKNKFNVSEAVSNLISWVGNYQLQYSQKGYLTISDFDGYNQQVFVTADVASQTAYSKDMKHALIVRAKAAGGYELINVDLRAGNDLPKT